MSKLILFIIASLLIVVPAPGPRCEVIARKTSRGFLERIERCTDGNTVFLKLIIAVGPAR